MAIYLDDKGYPVTYQGDGGDTAVRLGILALTNQPEISSNRLNLGICRHPNQTPWNNTNNFSRDQLLMAVHYWKKVQPCILSLYISRFGLFKCPNTERDKKGSVKLPYPHKFYKDSDPIPDTFPFYSITQPNPTLEVESRLFDSADILFPQHTGVLILMANLKHLYFLLPICYMFHLLDLMIHCLSNKKEENQMISMCYVYNTLSAYKNFNKKWIDVSLNYWQSRDEREYHDLLRSFVGD